MVEFQALRQMLDKCFLDPWGFLIAPLIMPSI